MNREVMIKPQPREVPVVLLGQGDYARPYTPALPPPKALAMVRTESRERGRIVVNVLRGQVRPERGVA